MMMSLDGKISTGKTDDMDFDRDFPNITGIREGLPQYYEIEKTMDTVSFNSGRVMSKIGINGEWARPKMDFMTLVIMDNSHLFASGVLNLVNWAGKVIIATSNKNHPAFSIKLDNLKILFYKELDFEKLFDDLGANGIERMTIQSGGTLNSILIRAKLIDFVDIVIAPALIGGKDVATLMDGAPPDLCDIKALKLLESKQLENSYFRLRYKVLN
jgi:2,5-diamino-6-(ribosylamino)-4(3H)-pyrimidinone 5'-phosphate reductase